MEMTFKQTEAPTQKKKQQHYVNNYTQSPLLCLYRESPMTFIMIKY